MKLYVDTNIFLDYLLERKNLDGKDISVPAQRLFYRAMRCEFFIVISDHTAEELNRNLDLEKATMLLEFLKKKIVYLYKNDADCAEAEKMGKDNFSDALHAALAKRSGADYIITRNTRHFEGLASGVKAKPPEDV